ncbi:hypothetical protein, partial [Staphylococcus aureus]
MARETLRGYRDISDGVAKQVRDEVRNEFFQAEDGIRDLRMSRGLGDVYKRQRVFRGKMRVGDN